MPEWQRIAGAVTAAAIGATAFTVWHQSVVNEKVYTVALVGLALISWLTIRWLDAPDGPRADRTLLLVAYAWIAWSLLQTPDTSPEHTG